MEHSSELHFNTTEITTAVMPKSHKSLSIVLSAHYSAEDNSNIHVLPINTLHSSETSLFSGGRDGIIAQYDRHFQKLNHIHLHSDWVNDLVHVPQSSILVSCSCDLSLKYWDYSKDAPNCHGVIGHHHDYVKALSYLSTGQIVSGGLDRTVKLWDIERKTPVGTCFHNTGAQFEDLGEKGSIYALTSNEKNVSIGDNAGNVTLIDPKTLKLGTRIVGAHNDVVKTLLMKDEHVLISGSSDKTVKFWDLRNTSQPINTQTFSNSLWTLYQDQEETYLGDSQGSIYKYQESTAPQLISKQSKGILSINIFDHQLIATTTENSNITNAIEPSKSITGNSGLIKSRFLNNRRYVVTLGTSGEIILWDILKCSILKRFDNTHEFEDVIDEYQTKEILPTWCRVTIKAGKLFIVVSESSFTNCEVYGDNLKEYFTVGGKGEVDEDIRYFLGKIFLMSIFKPLLDYEVAKDSIYRESKIKELSKPNKLNILTRFSSHETNSAGNSATNTPIEENKKFFNFGQTKDKDEKEESTDEKKPRLRLFQRKSSIKVVPSTAPGSSGNGTISESEDERPVTAPSILPSRNNSESSPETSRKPSTAHSDLTRSSSGPLLSTLEEVNQNSLNDSMKSILNEIYKSYETMNAQALAKSELTPPHIPREVPVSKALSTTDESNSDVLFIINEKINHAESDEVIDIYAETFPNLRFEDLETYLPLWVGNFLLRNRVAAKDFPKVGFIIQQHDPEEDLPKLDNGDARLNAYNMLRIKRVITYITERFEKRTREMENGLQAEDWLEVLCHGEVLPLGMTLATLRSFVWKSSGDVVLTYRRKTKPE